MFKETLVSIAERTGFSVSTVSRVLSGQAAKYRISDKTVALIRKEAERCNFTPSLLAKGLRTSRTNTLGLLVPSIDNPYFAHVASIIVEKARTHGYTVILIDTSEDERNEQEGVRSLVSRKVDGILIAPAGGDPSFLESVAQQTPVVCIDRYFARTTLPYVVTDNFQGGREGTQYLIDHGHERILCIQGVRHSMPSTERVAGYRQALAENGIKHWAQVVGDGFSIRNGYEQTLRALHVRRRPTAIFALSNTILLGSLKAIRELRLRIPEDISLLSFDNYEYLDYLDPAITRISQPSAEIGTQAMEILLRRMNGDTSERDQLRLAPSLVACRSVKRLEH